MQCQRLWKNMPDRRLSNPTWDKAKVHGWVFRGRLHCFLVHAWVASSRSGQTLDHIQASIHLYSGRPSSLICVDVRHAWKVPLRTASSFFDFHQWPWSSLCGDHVVEDGWMAISIIKVKALVLDFILNDNLGMKTQRFKLSHCHDVEQGTCMEFLEVRDNVQAWVWMNSMVRMRDSSAGQMPPGQKFLMILQVFERECLLRIHEDDTICEISNPKNVDLLTFCPSVVVSVGCTAGSRGAVFLFMQDLNRAIQIIENSINTDVIDQWSRATRANTFAQRTTVRDWTGATHCIEGHSAQMILYAVEGVVVRAQHVHDSTKGHDRRLATVFLHDETFMRLDCKEMMESLVEDDVAAIWQGCAGGPLE